MLVANRIRAFPTGHRYLHDPEALQLWALLEDDGRKLVVDVPLHVGKLCQEMQRRRSGALGTCRGFHSADGGDRCHLRKVRAGAATWNCCAG